MQAMRSGYFQANDGQQWLHSVSRRLLCKQRKCSMYLVPTVFVCSSWECEPDRLQVRNMV